VGLIELPARAREGVHPRGAKAQGIWRYTPLAPMEQCGVAKAKKPLRQGVTPLLRGS